MGLSDMTSSSLQATRTHNPSRRASEGMIDLRRPTLPPLPKSKNSSLKGLKSQQSVSPVITVVVTDDEPISSSPQRLFRRRGSSPWSKISSPSSPQSLSSTSHHILAPSPPAPPRSSSPSVSSQNIQQVRHGRYRRGSLPASTLSPISPNSSSDWKISVPTQNRPNHTEQSSEKDRHGLDQNSNALQQESLPPSLFSKHRSVSHYPERSRPAAHRRRSDGAIYSHSDRNHGEKSSSCNRSRTIKETQNKNNVKMKNDEQFRRHRKSKYEIPVDEIPKETLCIEQERDDDDCAFIPIDNDKHLVGDDDESAPDFDDDQDADTRQFILHWLEGVEKSSESTPALALDDFCRYNEVRETAIKVYYDGKEQSET